MKQKLTLTLLALVMTCGLLGGCVVYDPGYRHHGGYYHDRY